ncbi:hypothetical protein TNIN_334271 [Trichonephila inaurata madagascariensis]|uniref:Uncharacterized protein n=1 Tax=Trichonephila inaurata madagascariensis TaxID=2747483 RepID=A0A8X7C8R5_9ARAC|nr:hypothetical protein TNIN_334271 [Trichonephila inaurata madagascariensis]
MYPHALVSLSVPEIEPQIAWLIRERGGHVHQQLFPFAESEDEILRMIRGMQNLSRNRFEPDDRFPHPFFVPLHLIAEMLNTANNNVRNCPMIYDISVFIAT